MPSLECIGKMFIEAAGQHLGLRLPQVGPHQAPTSGYS